MKDRKTQSDDWIGEWIARQRELLSQKSAQADQATAANPAELLRGWFDAGRAFFDGSQDSDRETGAKPIFSDPFDVSSALLRAWANAGVLQAGIAQQASDALSRLPPLGLAREQTEAWRELAAAHAECQQIESELRAVLLKVQFDALDLLSEQIRKRAPDDPIDGFRALYDLWVECGEQVYGKLAHSEAYSRLQAQLGNATMKVRSRMQVVIEQGLKQFDLPTRSELNSLHRQMREQRMQVERLVASSRSGSDRARQPAPTKPDAPPGSPSRSAARRTKPKSAKSASVKRASTKPRPSQAKGRRR